ncbi:MAG: hypothetical protein AAF958_10135 [Planctomycetota bacterium]
MLEQYSVLPNSYANFRRLERTRLQWAGVTALAFGLAMVATGVRYQSHRSIQRDARRVQRGVQPVFRNRSETRRLVDENQRLQQVIDSLSNATPDDGFPHLVAHLCQSHRGIDPMRIERMRLDMVQRQFTFDVNAAPPQLDSWVGKLSLLRGVCDVDMPATGVQKGQVHPRRLRIRGQLHPLRFVSPVGPIAGAPQVAQAKHAVRFKP